MSEISIVGLDLAKNVFQVHAVDGSGKVVLRRQLRRGAVEKFFAQLSPCTVGIEACGSAHHWARVIGRYGPPGPADAAGLCEALREAQQERWPRRGGDLRGGGAADDAVRAGEERGGGGDD